MSQGKKPVDSSTSLLDHPDPEDGDISDTDMDETSRRRQTWGYGQGSKSQDNLGDWFKMKWWRKKWKEDEDHEEERPA